MKRFAALLLAATVLIPHARTQQAVQASEQTPHLTNPDAACARCHAAIYARYEQTPMAQGSGLATDALQPTQIHHTPSNIDYRIFSRKGEAYMSFHRSSASAPLEGERPLTYYLGSGRQGRTYLYQLDGLWFELPIDFYTRRNTWAMTPAYDDAKSMPVLPIDPNCLHCHATAVQPSLPTARNRFAAAPFLQGGIGCSACHGDPAQHLATHGHAPILNPSKLSPTRRDSACTQCHLEGDAVVYRPGRTLAQFLPGDDLADTAVFFVRATQQSGGGRAVSQYEALLRSACKRATGDRLTCTSCHDPHSTPTAAERVQYFRTRCLTCHTDPKLAATHHPEQPNCASCHMPTRPTADISHEQLTDHDIEAHPITQQPSPKQDDKLVPVGNTQPTAAEYGMAYAQLATHGNRFYRDQALHYLTQAAAENPAPTNPLLYAQLGFLKQIESQLTNQPALQTEARTAYQTSLAQDPYQPTALANLGVLEASTGQVEEAVHLLDRLIQADPSQTPAGLNLAWIECKLGHPTEALTLLHRLKRFNPDDPQLRAFETSGTYAGQHCSLTSN